MGNSFFTLLFILTITLFIKHLDGRYLRPSDHGLAYQNTTYPKKQDMPEMLSFFNGGKTTPFEPVPVPLPEARNLSTTSSSDPVATWWSKNKKSREGTGKKHVKQVLLLASLICGLTGVVLLVVSALVFIYRYRKQRLETEMAKQKPAVSSALVLALPSVVNKRDPNSQIMEPK